MNIFYVFKVIRDNVCFPFLRALIGLKKLAPLFPPIRGKLEPVACW